MLHRSWVDDEIEAPTEVRGDGLIEVMNEVRAVGAPGYVDAGPIMDPHRLEEFGVRHETVLGSRNGSIQKRGSQLLAREIDVGHAETKHRSSESHPRVLAQDQASRGLDQRHVGSMGSAHGSPLPRWSAPELPHVR